MYPSLVNCTTIDLFADWPHDALLEVGERYLAQIDLAGDDKVRILFEKNSFSSLIFSTNDFPVSNGKISVIVLFFLVTTHYVVYLFLFCVFCMRCLTFIVH